MELRRRIVINTDGSIPEPHFDDDAAHSARPVRPLAYTEETHVHSRPGTPLYAPVRKRSAVWPVVLVMVILLAVGVGLAAGYGIAHYGSFDQPEAIIAASNIHIDENAPEMTFTAPPEEEVAENSEDLDPDGQTSDEVDPSYSPDVEGDQDLFPSPPAPVRRTPQPPSASDDEPENSRPRRAPDDPNNRTSGNRRNKSSNDDNNAQIRRVGRGVLGKLRQIFEGNP